MIKILFQNLSSISEDYQLIDTVEEKNLKEFINSIPKSFLQYIKWEKM